jgi:tetratricopeptide (TPR) repeat protein
MLHHPRVTLSFTFAAAFLAFASALSGCAWWHNFSTYYNTVYLAETHLEAYEAQQRIIVAQNPSATVAVANHRWLDEERLMRQVGMRTGSVEPITPSFSQSLSATKQITNVHLDSAIILGSKILADKKATKYKEDALFIVGKAQFYKNDFIGAERKFHELLANYPQTKYGAQVQVYLARSMLVNHDIDTAAMTLERGLAATESNDPAVASTVHRAMAELIYAKNPDSLAAIAAELHKAEAGMQGEELARLAYQEGAVEYINGDWANAERAFQTTSNAAKDDWLAGEGRVAHALALREGGNLDAARAELAFVIAHAKYGGSQVAARFELAYTDELIARKAVGNDLRSMAFRDNYEHPMHAEYFALDTTYKSSSTPILSRVKFRQAEMYREMGFYDSAARIATSLISTKDFSSPAMNEYVSDRANSLISYSQWRRELDHIDTLEAAIKKSEVAPRHDVKVPGQDEDANLHLQALQEVLGTRWNPAAPVQMTKMDSTRIRETETRLKQKAPQKLVISDTAHFLDSLQFRAGTAHYQIGRAYETFGEIPEARAEYHEADSMNIGPMDTGRTALRAQTLYAWIELERQEKNQVMADSLLHELLSHYGQTMFAEQARILYVKSTRNSPGELAYLGAYKSLRESGVTTAKPALLQVVTNFSQEDVAPRSLFAIGVSYEEVPQYDSALAYYKRVLKDYPYSSYALALRPRFADASTPSLLHSPGRTVNPTITNNPSSTPPADGTQQSTPQTPPGIRQHPANIPPRHMPPPLPPGAPVPPILPPIPSSPPQPPTPVVPGPPQ